MAKFNPEQSQAIHASIDKDILITAGAGSGKTKTLSERVNRLISSGEIKPENLLVLTFTNNAAFEMKERIIQSFQKEDINAAKMLSSHVQTFDSFSQYIVKMNADVLGLPKRFSIADQSVLDAKSKEILESVLNEYYSDPIWRGKIVKFLSKVGLKNDEKLKSAVEGFVKELNKMLPVQRKEFLDTYYQKFVNDAFADKIYLEVVNEIKTSLEEVIWGGYFSEVHRDQFRVNKPGEPLYRSLFENQDAFFKKDIHSFLFENEEYSQPLYDFYLEVLEMDFKDVQKNCEQFLIDSKKTLFSGNVKGSKNPDMDSWKFLKTNGRDLIQKLADLPSVKENRDRIQEAGKDTEVILHIVKEVMHRLHLYKLEKSYYDFSDIAGFALDLLTNPKYDDAAEALRERFTYIMIDEYQDTNDLQEAFIASLTKINRKGTRAHLFCVGDAKQSIYRFRNSNVALFKKRQSDYMDGNGHEVIAMNKNYRSGPGLLKDINFLFTHAMTLEQGGIDYSSRLERLEYDTNVNLYHKDFDHFGIYRMMPPADPHLSMGHKDGGLSFTSRARKAIVAKEAEAYTILNDIKKKIASGYLVYDRNGDQVRPCRYDDFAILTRGKKSVFDRYQKVFVEGGVPLNCQLDVNLRKIDSIILIESLLRLIHHEVYSDPVDLKHLFASVARSYAYAYDDETVYQRLIGSEDELRNDPLMKAIENFSKSHLDSKFSVIFNDLLSTFHVIDRLPSIGKVSDNISKIDSLYQMVVSKENLGEGLDEFLKMLDSFKLFDLELKAESIVQSKGAVDLMTIHASKGLERKIVYIPVSESKLSSEPNQKKPPFAFNMDYGFQLSGLDFDPIDLHGNFQVAKQNSLGQDLIKGIEDKAELDEHIRLLYVALTRAENAIIIVGSPSSQKGDIYWLLDQCPSLMEWDPDFKKFTIEKGIVPKELFDSHARYSLERKECMEKSPLHNDHIYLYLRNYFFNTLWEKKIADIEGEIFEKIFGYYSEQVAKLAYDDPLLIKIYADTAYPGVVLPDSCDLKTFLKAIQNQVIDDDDEEEGEGVDNDDDEMIVIDDLKRLAAFFASGKAKDDHKHYPAFSKIFAYRFDGFANILTPRYFGEGYDDACLYVKEARKEKADVTFPKGLPHLKEDSTPILFEEKEKKRASKQTYVDHELNDALAFGTHLHELLELLDFATFDTSFIVDDRERHLVDRVLALPLMQEAKASEAYPEYGYFDPLYETTGFIDLLYIKDGVYHIVDYKTKDIEDDAYIDQLHAYQRNIERLFHIDASKVRLHLLSILDAKVKDIPTE